MVKKLVIALILAVGTCFAQGPAGPPPPDPGNVTHLKAQDENAILKLQRDLLNQNNQAAQLQQQFTQLMNQSKDSQKQLNDLIDRLRKEYKLEESASFNQKDLTFISPPKAPEVAKRPAAPTVTVKK